MPVVGESLGSSVIRLDGAFNPAIVSADWLLGKGLIDEADRQYVLENEALVVTPQFSGGGYPWIVVEVTREALHAASTDSTETPERVREFVVGLMGALPETPVHGLTVRYFWHVATGTERWQTIAAELAPDAHWDDVLPDSELSLLDRRAATDHGHVSVSVQSSRRRDFDLYLEVEHYWDFGEPPGVGPGAAISTLDEHWEAAWQRSKQILDATLRLA